MSAIREDSGFAEIPMRHTRFIQRTVFLAFVLVTLASCGRGHSPAVKCTVVFEDNPSLYFPKQIYDITSGEDLHISIGVPHGERIASVSYEDYSISAKTGDSLSYDYYTLTLRRIRYPSFIRLATAPVYTTAYHSVESAEPSITIQEESPHLAFNTLPFREQFLREGYLPIGWNTEPDGAGAHIGFGSRIARREVQHLDLYMEWLPCSSPDSFSYVSQNGEITITGWLGTGNIVIPSTIDGFPVTAIAANAFGDVKADYVALPWTLKSLDPGAFKDLAVNDFYFFDSIETIPEEAFENYTISRLHINAVLDPVYSGSYFATLADKADYLSSVKNQAKIVLLSGSSARFGYDSPRIESAFPDYKVVNMGVYAYSNMLPQAMLVLSFLKEGDILISSPELDAIEYQFCGEKKLDKETFCMMESNYDLFALLDCTKFTQVFHAFEQYNAARRDMNTCRSYLDSPSRFDEDGSELNTPSYNHCGDYILYRENNLTRKSFGVKRAFYHADHIRAQDLDGLNAVYDAFAQKGVAVFFTYSPRSNISISPDSTQESIEALDKMLRDTLHAHMLSPIRSSLMDPLYFYGTDNHLSTEGASLHTEQIIRELQATADLL